MLGVRKRGGLARTGREVRFRRLLGHGEVNGLPAGWDADPGAGNRDSNFITEPDVVDRILAQLVDSTFQALIEFPTPSLDLALDADCALAGIHKENPRKSTS